MAAIVQERRQRAADAFEARMSIRIKDGHGDNGVDMGSEEDSSVIVVNQKPTRRLRILSAPASHQRGTSSRSSGGSSEIGCTSFDRDLVKLAYRRRSISEDTYNRQNSTIGDRSGRGGGGKGGGEEGDASGLRKSSVDTPAGGVICSDDDIRAIVSNHRRLVCNLL